MTDTRELSAHCDRCRQGPATCVWEGNYDHACGFQDDFYLCAACQPHWTGTIPPEYDDEPPEYPDGTPVFPTRKLTRQERLQAAADAGHDTWDEYRGDR